MKKSRSLTGVVVRLVVFTVVIVLLLVGVVIAIKRPIGGSTDSVTAVFTDASGLRTNGDVRMYGVAVGKVSKIELSGTLAKVTFTVQRDRPLYSDSRFAIRYQNLTGQRYLDIKQPDKPGPRLDRAKTVDTDHTVPSFDITTLFNGMEPVLAEFSPDALNQFMRNAIAVIEGDGTQIGATLDAIAKLSSFVSDRQAVLSLLLRNFQEVYEHIGGRSPETKVLIQGISDVFVNLQKQIDGLLDAVDVAPRIVTPLNKLLEAVGFTQPDNPDLQTDISHILPDPQATADMLNQLPALLSGLTALVPDTNSPQPISRACRNGAADIPTPLAVLIAGQRVTICNG